MFFDKKEKKCESCGNKVQKNHSFCPSCGCNISISKKEKKDLGLLGKNDYTEIESNPVEQNFGITDKLINSVFNSLMKNLDKQFKQQFGEMERGMENAEVKAFPNGIRIKIAGPQEIKPKKIKKEITATQVISPGQIEKMSAMPRAKAKSSVKRLGNKIIYELSTPGISSPQDVFVSKLESGYEVKVIGNKKVYVNSIPINLPMRKYSILKNKLLVEFNAQEE